MTQNREQPILLESICLEDGQFPLLQYHQDRVDHSRLRLYGVKKRLSLANFLAEQSFPSTGRHKVRITYGQQIDSCTCTPYHIRPIETLRIVEVSDGIPYRFKFADRDLLEDAFSRREGCDEVLITWRGFLTDASYANIALFDGEKWYTPAHPLLKGVRRTHLLRNGELQPTVVRSNDLKYFREVRLINAMIGLKESPSIPIKHVYNPGDRV